MDIILYSTTDKPNTINKTLTAVKTITGNAVEPMDILNPVVMVKIDNVIFNANYAYIAKFNRYYFIQKLTVDKGFINIQMDVDVLESFKTNVLDYIGIIDRQEYDYNLFLDDNQISAYSKPLIQIKKLPNTPFNKVKFEDITASDRIFVLITISD